MNFIDLHTDTPLKILRGEKNTADFLGHKFERYVQNMAIWINDSDSQGAETYERTVTALKRYLKDNKIPLIKRGNIPKTGVILSIENASFLTEKPEYLEKAVEDGVGIISLSWNGENPLAGGCMGDGGLTAEGIRIVEKINDFGIAVDISHLNDKSAKQIIKLADYPIATHSNCSSVFNHIRNLSDERLLQLKDSKGIVGLCFYPDFLGTEDVFKGIEDNINHLVSLGMEDNIAIGSDFDGAEMDKKLSTAEDVPLLFEYLKQKGMKKLLLERIFYKNALAFFKRICKNIR